MIHPSAVIDPAAVLDPSADIGPYVVIEGPVRVGAGTRIRAHVHLTGTTTIGAGCDIFPFASIGGPPQDRAYKNDLTYCTVGDETILREGVTVHCGTTAGTTTVIGNRCLLMANSHVGHNCTLADDVVMVNGTILGGYVQVGPRAFLSGNAGVHQFVRIGELAMIGGVCKVVMDIPPFFTVGDDGTCVGVNTVGMRRAGFTAPERAEVKHAFRTLYHSGLLFRAALEQLESSAHSAPLRRLVAFLQAESRRGIASARSTPSAPAPTALQP